MEKKQYLLISIVKKFLSEFKSEWSLQNIKLTDSLERDLGIDSLGKVELFLRIEKAFNVHFKDSLMRDAETLNDILNALENAPLIESIDLKQTMTSALEETRINPLSFKTLVEVLIRRAEKEPNRPHVYFQDENGKEHIIRYGQLLESSKKVATGLHELNLKQSETVAIMLPTSEEFFYAFFGVLLAGGIPVPIYPPIRADRIEEYAVREANILNNAEVRILITFHKVEALSKLLRVFIKSLYAVTTVDSLIQSTKRLPHFVIKETDPALIQYTSGSTSAPKGVLLTHHNLLSNIRAFGQAIDLGPHDVGVSWLPLYHDMGLIGAWLGSVYHAFPLTILSPLTFLNRPERWLWAIHYHRATLSAGPNFAYELCVRKIEDKDIQGLDLSSWRLAFNGAEAIDPNTLNRFIERFKPYGLKAETIFPVYGLAENAVALTFPPLNRKFKVDTISRDIFEKEQKAIPIEETSKKPLQFVSCGKPLPDHDIRIVDEEGKELPERSIGSLYFTGPSSMQGYYNNLEASKAIYHEGYWDSGDYAYIADGEVYITGRKKDVIIKAGRNLYPQEIEEVTGQVSGIRKGCVVAFGLNDPKWATEKLLIVAETHETNQVTHQQLKSKILEKVSDVIGIQPDEIILVAPKTIPKTSSGKLQRSLCKQMVIDGKISQKALPAWLQIIKLYVKSQFIKASRFLSFSFNIIFTVYVALLLLIFIPPMWVILLLFPHNPAAFLIRSLTKLLLKLTFNPIHIKNSENILKKQSTIYVANHASYVDSLILMALLPQNTAFVGKKEIKNWPIVGTAVKKLGFLTVDRMDFSKNLEDMVEIEQTLHSGRSILIYPEGTFTYATGLRPFKLGAFKLSTKTHTPICPIAIDGTRFFLRSDSFLLKRHPIRVTIGEPIYPKSEAWEEVTHLHTMARSFIAENCGEHILDVIPILPPTKRSN